MKQFRPLFRSPLYYLFPFYSRKEKIITVLFFSGIVIPTIILMPQFGLIFYLATPLLFIIMAFLGKILLKRVIKNNTLICNEIYFVKIETFTKAFGIRFRKNMFIINLAFKYPRYEDLMADFDEDYNPPNPDIKKNFKSAFLTTCALIAFLASFLFEDASLRTKIFFLAIACVFIIFIVITYLQLGPLVKDLFRDRYKKDKDIIAIIKTIKQEIETLSPKYVASTDLKTLIWNSTLLCDDFRTYFQLKASRQNNVPVR